MKIEEQVLSIEQMKHLQELGVDTSDASMCWLRYDFGGVVKQYVEINDVKWHEWSRATQYPTYTIGDLIEKLPEDLRFRCQGSNYSFSKNWDSLSFGYERIIPHSNNLIEGLFTLLCWVAENHKELL